FMEGVQMLKRVKLVLLTILLSITGSPLNANESESDAYLEYVRQITNSFIEEMEDECPDFHCIGSGGSMPYDVEEIEVCFVAHRRATVEEARRLEVYGVQKLLNKINAHEKIRPYLREYPFKSNRVGMSIAFYAKNDEYHHDGSVVYVSVIKSKVFYDRAEKRKSMIPGRLDCRDPNNTIETPPREEITEELISLFEEPYEDALRIVQGTES
ncbi:MAG: hypothetical protein LLG04_15145, partial [Parachlamydia sp.]|nr:hypothetical protein [Parachlamydia sp.]